MKVETPIIALIIASLFFLGVFGFFTQIGNTYAEAGMVSFTSGNISINNGTQSVDKAFNQINKTKQGINEISGEFQALEPSFLSIWPAINIMFKTGKLIVDSVKTINVVGTATSDALGVDPLITNGLFLVLLIVIILGVLLIISGRTQ